MCLLLSQRRRCVVLRQCDRRAAQAVLPGARRVLRAGDQVPSVHALAALGRSRAHRGLVSSFNHDEAPHGRGLLPHAALHRQRARLPCRRRRVVPLCLPHHHRLDVLQGPVQPLRRERVRAEVLGDGRLPLHDRRVGDHVPDALGARGDPGHAEIPHIPGMQGVFFLRVPSIL